MCTSLQKPDLVAENPASCHKIPIPTLPTKPHSTTRVWAYPGSTQRLGFTMFDGALDVWVCVVYWSIRHRCSCLWSFGPLCSRTTKRRRGFADKMSQNKRNRGLGEAYAVESGPYVAWGVTGQPTPSAADRTCGFGGWGLVERYEAAEKEAEGFACLHRFCLLQH